MAAAAGRAKLQSSTKAVSMTNRLKSDAEATAELKAQEAIMMETQRRLRTAKSGGGLSEKVHIEGTMEHFIQQITTRAISGSLEKGDESVLRERIEADIAAIEWVKLAQKQGALSFKEDVIALGGELQLRRGPLGDAKRCCAKVGLVPPA